MGRAEKFLLGALDEHRGKTVDQLIHESVENYLDRESFGSSYDVNEVLTQMGLDNAPFKPLYADLDQMMKRRHRIVHEADLPSPKDSLSIPWTINDDFNLNLWLLVVVTFYTLLRVSVDPADEVLRWFLASRMKAIELARQACAEIYRFAKSADGVGTVHPSKGGRKVERGECVNRPAIGRRDTLDLEKNEVSR